MASPSSQPNLSLVIHRCLFFNRRIISTSSQGGHPCLASYRLKERCMAGFQFEALLIRPEGVGTWTFLNIPAQVSSTFGSKGQVRVKGTINGYPFQSTALPMGDGTHYLVVAKDIREHIAVSPGDTVKVAMQLDPGKRVVQIPDDLLQALLSQPEVKERFEK